MKHLLLTALLLSTGYLYFSEPAKTSQLENSFNEYISQFGKEYTKAEQVLRFKIFQRRVVEINIHNDRYNKGEETYFMGINQFTDQTHEELTALLMSGIPEMPDGVEEKYIIGDESNEEVDWQAKGAVQRVKNQGSCGSCWAFSVIAQLESSFQIAGRGLQDLAEQQLVDCSSVAPYKCYGCSGCWPKDAYDYVKDKGVVQQSSYPYTARQGACKVQSGDWKIKSFDMVPAGNTDQLTAYARQSPVSVCVDASNWFSYSGGIFKNCGTQLNHAVLLTGFTDTFWRIKNSWGNWGEQGYIRLARPGNTCGIANHSLRANV